MIPAAFDYRRATSLDDALAALAGGDAKVIAGGIGLLPLMKLRLAQPAEAPISASSTSCDGSARRRTVARRSGRFVTYAEAMAATSLDFARDCLEHRRRPGPPPRHDRRGSPRPGKRRAGARAGARLFRGAPLGSG